MICSAIGRCILYGKAVDQIRALTPNYVTLQDGVALVIVVVSGWIKLLLFAIDMLCGVYSTKHFVCSQCSSTYHYHSQTF